MTCSSGMVEAMNHLLALDDKLLSIRSGSLSAGKYPIHHAARWGHPKCIQAIIDFQPSAIEQCDADGNNALHEACQWSRLECVTVLLSSAHCSLSLIQHRNAMGF